MSQTNMVVTQLAQLGFADRIAHEAQGHPEIARQAAQQAAPEILKQQKDSVGETEDTEAARKLKSGKDRQGGRERRGGSSGKRRQENGTPESPSVPNTPWAGNILNLKV